MNKFYLPKLSFGHIAKHIKTSPILLIPIAPLEPIGDDLPLEALELITTTLTKTVSEELSILSAPSMVYGFNTPFQSFEGALSIKRDSFIKQIADIARTTSEWGIKKVIFVDGTVTSAPLIAEALKKYQRKLPENFSYKVITWQNLPLVRKFTRTEFEGLEELWRSEAAIRVLYSELTDSSPLSENISSLPQKELFIRWKRRGLDPHKLKAYTPKATLSQWRSFSGKPLFSLATSSIKKEITSFIGEK